MKKDLVVLAADKDLEYTLRGLFTRHRALHIRPIEFDIYVESEHDPACALRGIDFLVNFAEQYRHGLLMFDHEGSGKEQIPCQDLQQQLNEGFARSAWRNRAKAIVLSPELEAWIWSPSPHVEEVAGWKGRQPDLHEWLVSRGWLLSPREVKPRKPKEAFEAALREVRTRPRSSSLYARLAQKVSLAKCKDAAFNEFRKTLVDWFPEDARSRES